MLSYGECVQYLSLLYNNINGEINPIIPATRLALTEAEPIGVDSTSVGTQCIMTVEIRLGNALRLFSNYGLMDNEIRGALLYILTHELSHCDQKTDPMKRLDNDKQYEMYIEYTNNINTARFLKENENILQTLVGPYKIPPIIYTGYTEQRKYFNDSFYAFPQISSIKEKVLDGLSILVNQDIYKTKYPLVNNIVFDIYVQGKLLEKHNIIRNKNLVSGKSDINRISHILSRYIFDYKSSLRTEKDTCIISIYMDSPPMQNVVIIG